MILEIVILAAGQGTRMRSALPKVLHQLGHLTLLEHVYRLATALAADRISIVYGHGGDQAPETLAHLDAAWVEQKERLGTGHAVMQVADHISDTGTVLVLCNGIILGKPENKIEISLAIGWFVALLACLMITYAGFRRQAMRGAVAKPPGVI